MIEELFLALGVIGAIALFFLFCWLNKLADNERMERLRQVEADIQEMKTREAAELNRYTHLLLAAADTTAPTYDRVPDSFVQAEFAENEQEAQPQEAPTPPPAAEPVTELVEEPQPSSQLSDMERELQEQMRNWSA